MDLALLLFMGFWALPFYWMIGLTLLFIVDVVLCESEAFGWGASTFLAGIFVAAWLGSGVNPFAFTWDHLADLVSFGILYCVAGAGWSMVKWYFYLLKVRSNLKSDQAKWREDSEQFKRRRSEYYSLTVDSDGRPIRPADSYAGDQKGNLMGWIALWPFSVIGTFFGDFLTRIVTNIYNVMSGLYDRVGNRVFKGLE